MIDIDRLNLALCLRNLGACTECRPAPSAGKDLYEGLWLTFSSKSSKYDSEEARAKWACLPEPIAEGSERPRLGLDSLRRWAREDSPEAYRELREAGLPEGALTKWQEGDGELADLAYELLRERVKLTARKNGTYYVFDERECAWIAAGDCTLRRLFSRTLVKLLREVQAVIQEDAPEESDDKKAQDAQEAHEARLASLSKVIGYVGSASGISNVLRMGGEMYYERDFEARLDSIPHLLGVANGVVDLRTGELRARRPEDMLCNVLGVAYDATAESGWVQKLTTATMADDEEMAQYLQKLLGYGISGEVSEEIFVVFTAGGRNGAHRRLAGITAPVLGLD